MKKIVILEHDGGELANQLWNHLSIAAYAAEKGVACDNWSFYEYPNFFAIRQPHWLVRIVFEPRFIGYRKRKAAFKTRLWRKIYKFMIVFPISFFAPRRIISSTDSGTNVYHLPPTEAATQKLQSLEQEEGTVYFANRSGSVFRNREGIVRHREALVQIFRPNRIVQNKVDARMSDVRVTYAHIIGVHIRQGDYSTFKGGRYALPQTRVKEILEEFLAHQGYNKEETYFFIASDGSVDESMFVGLNITISKHDVGTDLFMLAACDVVIGSDSTLGHFAAYFGNIPHIIMKKEEIDWEYYKNQKEYFANKYLTIMAY